MPQHSPLHGDLAADPARDRDAGRLLAPALLTLSLLLGTGCTSIFSGRSEEKEKESRLRELMTVPEPPELIRQAAIPHGMRPIQVDGVAVIHRLRGTGGPADPSALRDQLLEEMKRDDIKDPNHLLEDRDTALVRVRGVVAPGAQRRDFIDLRVLAPVNSRVTDLHGGKLERARLRHEQLIQSAVRKSEVLVMGYGHLLTRADYDPGEDEALKTEGTLLSGGMVQVNRKLGLVLRPEFEHAKLSADIAAAINKRFFFFDGSTRRGIAKAIEDDFIEIDLHPRYRANVYRLMEVVRAIRMNGRSDSHQRLTELAERLKDPASAADAAIQLEAIGESAIPTLVEAIGSANPELRFYAAEALAYLDEEAAIEPLEQSAREVAAFRHDALLALQELPPYAAVEALKRLMDEPSLETRYGSFRAIRRRKEAGGNLRGRDLKALKLYRVPSDAPPAVVISLREKPEVVLFGSVGQLREPEFIRLASIMLKPSPNQPGKLRISHFAPGEEDRIATADSSIAAVVQAIISVGGGYGDVVATLRKAKDKGYLADQLAIDPLPRPLRTYHREESDEEQADEEDTADQDSEDFDVQQADLVITGTN